MNDQERIRVQREFAGLSMFFHKQKLDNDVLAMYWRDVSDLPCDAVLCALETLRREPKRRTMPLPADVRALVAPRHETPDAAANKMAGDIVKAIGAYGYMRVAAAHEHLGDTAWRVVEAKGGWSNICQNLQVNDTSFFAQCRELARAFIAEGPREYERNALRSADVRGQIEKVAYDNSGGTQVADGDAIASIQAILKSL
jgi:hypothetical protein